MLHMRIIAPSQLADRVLAMLADHPSVTNLVRLAGAARKPHGDVLLCDVAREDASVILAELRRLRVDEVGSIAVEAIQVSLSAAADHAEEVAVGSPGDAVVWEEVETQTASSAELTLGLVLLMVLATVIAAAGILTDSVVLIIGAMVVGPEFGPLAGVCVAIIERRSDLALRSVQALLVGFPVAIAGAFVVVEGLRAAGLTPDTLERTQTMFISHPDAYTVLVALLAGLAGMLSLTTAKSGALIGVLISVTTIPAAANIAVAAAYRDWTELGGASLQLGLNLACIVLAGIATLAIQRFAFYRRVSRLLASRARRQRQLDRASRGAKPEP